MKIRSSALMVVKIIWPLCSDTVILLLVVVALVLLVLLLLGAHIDDLTYKQVM